MAPPIKFTSYLLQLGSTGNIAWSSGKREVLMQVAKISPNCRSAAAGYANKRFSKMAEALSQMTAEKATSDKIISYMDSQFQHIKETVQNLSRRCAVWENAKAKARKEWDEPDYNASALKQEMGPFPDEQTIADCLRTYAPTAHSVYVPVIVERFQNASACPVVDAPLEIIEATGYLNPTSADASPEAIRKAEAAFAAVLPLCSVDNWTPANAESS